MPAACVQLRADLTYRRDAFEAGLARHGLTLEAQPKPNPEPGDVLVLWNRKSHEERQARAYERAGATVIVTENGYIGQAWDGGKLYALARSHHNGRGTWNEGSPDRWVRQGIDIRPWRTHGEFVLLLPQRGIGEGGVAMPMGWANQMFTNLPGKTRRPIRLRKHPGLNKAEPVEHTFAGAWCAVTWGSGAGIKALAWGIPVFHLLKGWIGAPASKFGVEDIEHPYLGERLAMFRRLASAQWSLDEIASGEAFACLLAA